MYSVFINRLLLKKTLKMFSLLVQKHFLPIHHLILSGSAAINTFCPQICYNDLDFVVYNVQSKKGLKKYPRLPVFITIGKERFKLKNGQYREGSKTGEELSSVTYESVDNLNKTSFDIIFIEKKVVSVVIDELRVVEPRALLKIYEENEFLTMDVKMKAYKEKVAALKLYIQEQSESLALTSASASASASVKSLEKHTLSFGTPEKRELSFDSPKKPELSSSTPEKRELSFDSPKKPELSSSTPEKRELSFDSPVQSLCFKTPLTQKRDKENANSDCLPRCRLSF